MGRPKEFTEAQRADLLAKGYQPLEIWVIDRNSETFQQEAAHQVRSAAEADARDGEIDEWTTRMSANLWEDDRP